MKRIIRIEISSISFEALQWAVDCIKEDLKTNIAWRKKDTEDPNIEITSIQECEVD